mmetsp:Transcript_14486/g.21313  ORF Transcript_14486/g.21313 Transcript_14486/m.21313 type:complete len:633 (-) Transcript_14486:211-2109(-)|eukprot:CAMPEP_0113943096 /NCGR_PEP_ID=MMETSP1339-20121228/19171_1 /TAXON_ID=94617 /ORGANISM="Fibrocapsa japonica" /LENGTH=632 /DNA_ID=CAMNT_0000947865 /DNA_START=111 /DNA_END=2009 /DNA_ORIENTATION=- /assembly_acc=CAM_ASM_000762
MYNSVDVDTEAQYQSSIAVDRNVSFKTVVFRRLKLASLAAGAALVILGVINYQNSNNYTLSNLIVFPWEIENAPPPPPSAFETTYAGPYDYMTHDHGAPPDTHRIPVGDYQSYTTDFFSHPVVAQAFSRTSNQDIHSKCSGPNNNIDVWYNEAMVKKDLIDIEAYNAFGLDCRDENAEPLIAFIVVMDMKGQLMNVHAPRTRAESVVMFNTDTVLFSTIADGGVFLWNWKTNDVQRLPVSADAHTVQYSHKRNKFYGLYLDKFAMDKFSPSIAVIFNGENGQVEWQFTPDSSHINYLSVDGDYMYISLRSSGCLQKVDTTTSKVVWTLGGKASGFSVYDADGNFYDTGKKMRNSFRPDAIDKNDLFGSWQHQHRFQHFDDRYYGLFDNNMCSQNRFCDHRSSRFVILGVDENRRIASEVFSYETGDQAVIYGSSDLLPSGNVAGNSYPVTVFPAVPDRQYHVNFQEVTPDGQLVWRVGIKGWNPWNPTDVQRPYSHQSNPSQEPPSGWLTYDVERFYAAPVLTKPCQTTRADGTHVIRTLPHNTVRTQEDMPGVAYLFDSIEKHLISKTFFDFQKSWVPRILEVEVPNEHLNSKLALLVMNSWQDSTPVEIGSLMNLQSCEEVDAHRFRAFV